MMTEVDSRRLSDTESFLKRVEEYDSQRRSAAKSKPPLKEKPNRLRASFSEESLLRARRLLDGASPRELEEMHLSKNALDTRSSELAYKSAYNYEKSFSPPRNSQSAREGSLETDSSPLRTGRSGKTYVVSEEDFLLLQQLKISKEGSSAAMDCEPVKRHYPSRGRPREIFDHSTSLPRRPASRDELNSSDEKVPSLPARKYRETSDRILDVKVPSSNEEPAKESSLLAPKRKGPPKIEQKQKMEHPPTPPKSRAMKSRVIGIKEPAESPEPVTFLESLEKNKLTVKAQVGAPQVNEKPLTSHLDFLDSVQLNPEQQNELPKTPVKISPSAVESGSFIKSALNTSPLAIANVSTKPALPRKPARFQTAADASIAPRPSSLDKKQNEIKLTKLRAVEKPKPKVPAKKENLIIPKLRPVVPPKKGSIELNKRLELASPKSLKKVDVPDSKKSDPTVPEALARIAQLKRSSSPSRVSTSDDVPEAVSKLGGLRKLKDAPPVPKRNISLPEALQKAEKLRSAPSRPQKPSSKPDFRAELNVVLRAPKPEMQLETKASSSSLCSDSSSTSSLTHPNKTRSRGPKRKLPTNVS